MATIDRLAGTCRYGTGKQLGGVQIGAEREQLLATAAGTLLGSLIGSDVGKSLDRADLVYAN